MHVLRNFIETLEGLTELAAAAARNPVAQGVVMDINPIWLNAYRMERAGLHSRAFDLRWYGWPGILLDELCNPEPVEGDAIDFKWTDKSGMVENITHHLLQRSQKHLSSASLPFIVKVIARPVGAELFEARSQLVNLVTSQRFLALVETRPLGRLAVASGDTCLAGGVPGTIGGFLRDGNSVDIYAATCGHVAAKHASVAVAGAHLGTCSDSHPPTQLPPGQYCAPACSSSNKLDFALIDVGNASVANVVTGIASQIISRQSIILRGGMSGVNTFEVGGLVLTYCPGNSNVCFENMFEVRPRLAGGILNPKIRTALATVPTQGDSGGWLETTSASEWCGVLVATDTLMGYALEADDTISEANTAFNMNLRVV